MGALASGSPGAVSHRDERRVQRLELGRRLPQVRLHLGALGREELERHLNLRSGAAQGDWFCSHLGELHVALGERIGHDTRILGDPENHRQLARFTRRWRYPLGADVGEARFR